MGGKCPHRKVKKRRFSHKTHRRSKFLLKDILFQKSVLYVISLSIILSYPLFYSMSLSLIEILRDDMVYDELLKQAEAGQEKPLPQDEDLPGMGQFYCVHCDRYFANDGVRSEHYKSKVHKKKVKQMMGPAPHTQVDADLAAGMGRPDNGPKLMSM